VQIQIFSDVILSSITEIANNSVTGFLPMVGHQYCGQLMVVGRAVNGWTKGIAPNELHDHARRQDYAHQVYQSVTENMGAECPMSWVTGCWGATENYNTRRSAFWRVIRAIVGQLNISDTDDNTWPSHLIWSNLYKIAPAGGGNPGTGLRRAQFTGCKELLRWELENYRPYRILFLTGRAWADPFLTQMRDDRGRRDHSFVERVGCLPRGPHHAAACVVANHPQGKNETNWVNEVVAAFGY
jgi:hypothetical protein